MTSVTLLTTVVVGLIAGFIATHLRKRNDLPTNLIVGLLGAFVAPVLAGLIGLSFATAGTVPYAVTAAIGAVIAFVLLDLIKRAPKA
ncbi:MAG: GlsB/YeaQ/YmgE family stress response membrane protein [Proteobacteria bacterium]|nr:GlsB/YeaQ/YmgE family stress response membrane protein [Pseudomonadota bacterium]